MAVKKKPVGERAAHRPRLYDDPLLFEAKTDQYFDQTNKPSLSGLAYFLGFCDRESFAQYEEYGEDFSRTVKKARLRIEMDRQERLLDKNTFTPGVIFDLKNNHGWKDTTQVNHADNEGGKLQPVLNILGSKQRTEPAPAREAGTRVLNGSH